MKNSCWKHPFPTFSDKIFDGNKNGKLDAFETAFRDAHIEEMNRNAEKRNTQPKNKFVASEKTNEQSFYEKPDSVGRNNSNTVPIGVQLFFILLSVIVLFAGIIFAIVVEGTLFIRAVILFGAVAIATGLLKFVGLYK